MSLCPRLVSGMLARSPAAMARSLVFFSKRHAHSENLDVDPGKCCKIRDAESQKCLEAKMTGCKPTKLPNDCIKHEDPLHVFLEQYPKHLLKIIRPLDDKCELYRHDTLHYEPSDKTRRYQRTWPECPLIWLRPRKICCPEPVRHLPAERRTRKPPSGPISVTDKFAHKMRLVCQETRWHTKPELKCKTVKSSSQCTKEMAPFPSFSECNQLFTPRYCDTECACRAVPSLCELWRLYHRNTELTKSCTKALVNYCPFKRRARPLH
ncbi:uncharacterized protein LOC115563784 [Drosophila navojoa]|nr:uncharacterized protein LOC115563784 [Drosophila navojoa]